MDDKSVPSQSPAIYRVIWRWHFFAGIIVAPILFLMAATGALYIFRQELDEWWRHDLYYSQSQHSSRVSLDNQVSTGMAHANPGSHLERISVFSNPLRTTEIGIHNEEDKYQRLMVDPSSGQIRGEIGDGDFFDIVLTLHRTLFMGTAGRVITELSVSWTIILLITGLYLWWPRGSKRGVWWPRWHAPVYTRLRDLHAVFGAWLWPIAVTIAVTGLLYTLVWGSAYQYAAYKTGAYDIFFDPPRSRSPAEMPALTWQKLAEIARHQFPDKDLGFASPHQPGQAVVVFVSGESGPSVHAVLVLDHATGEILDRRTVGEFPLLGAVASWNYSLHVGSVLGLPTKILWLIACLVLMMLPVTGVWMWWQRRPKGHTGFPRYPTSANISTFIVSFILLLGILLPLAGVSIVIIFIVDWCLSKRSVIRSQN